MINVQDKQFGRMGNRFFQLAYLWAQFREGKIPGIYLQDPKYFDKYKDEIKEMFKQEGEPLNYISVHVRRGKNPSVPTEPAYSENPFYVNLLDTDYYVKAMEQFPNEKFMFFSDDMEWIRSNTKFPVTQIEDTDELEDFNTMTRCKGHIIANSSFSWWAAYLGGGKTVAPKEWFTDKIDRVGIPPEWIRI